MILFFAKKTVNMLHVYYLPNWFEDPSYHKNNEILLGESLVRWGGAMYNGDRLLASKYNILGSIDYRLGVLSQTNINNNTKLQGHINFSDRFCVQTQVFYHWIQPPPR